MVRVKRAAAFAAAIVLAVQPCAAASFESGTSAGTPSAFAGVNVRLPLGQAKARPEARLQFTSAYTVRDVRTGAVESFKAKGLEIGAARNGKPTFFLNGQSGAAMQKRLGMNGSTGTTVLIVGGVLLALVVVAVAAGGAGMGDTCPTIGGSRDHCINP